MKLYLISQTQNNGYDSYDSAVVAARNAEAARTIHPAGTLLGDYNVHGTWCDNPSDVAVLHIGNAVAGTTEGTVICASFNAG